MMFYNLIKFNVRVNYIFLQDGRTPLDLCTREMNELINEKVNNIHDHFHITEHNLLVIDLF